MQTLRKRAWIPSTEAEGWTTEVSDVVAQSSEAQGAQLVLKRCCSLQTSHQGPSKGQPGYVSRPTVYRTLGEFVDAGLLRKFVLDGRSVYEHDYGYPQHDHLYCSKCEKLIEFQSDELIKIRDEVGKTHSFQVKNHRLIVTGICEDCRRGLRRVRRKVDLI